MNNFLSSYAIDLIEPYILYFALFLIVAFLVISLFAYIKTKKLKNKITKISLNIIILLFAVFGIIFLILEILKHYDLSYLEKNYVNKKVIYMVFLPLIITLLFSVFSGIFLFVISKTNEKKLKTYVRIFLIMFITLIITSLVLIAVYYSTSISKDDYYSSKDYGNLNSFMLYLSAGILISVLILVSLITDKADKTTFNTKTLSLAGITIALSFALSFVKIFQMPQGGSITLLSLLPIMTYSYLYGAKKGLLIGIIYGLLQAVQSPYVIHPAQFILDYPVAFSSIAFAGIFKGKDKFNKANVKFLLGAFISGLLRYVSHVLSGIFAFGAYALDNGYNGFLAYSSLYNLYVLIDVTLVAVFGFILFKSKTILRELQK